MPKQKFLTCKICGKEMQYDEPILDISGVYWCHRECFKKAHPEIDISQFSIKEEQKP